MNGMDTSIPQSQRALTMILALLEGVTFPASDELRIRRALNRRSSNKARGPHRGLACKRNHPDEPPRWTSRYREYTRLDGTVALYELSVCLACVSVRDAKRLSVKPRVRTETHPCDACSHRKHTAECWHRDPSTKAYDCQCTGGPQ